MNTWYTSRNGIVRGPFSALQIEKHILLGRLGKDDLLSSGKQDWSSCYDFPELMPNELKTDNGLIDYDELIVARQRNDERSGQRRYGESSETNDRRLNPDRRQQGSEVEVLLTMARYAESFSAKNESGCTYRAGLLALLLALVIYVLLVPGGIL